MTPRFTFGAIVHDLWYLETLLAHGGDPNVPQRPHETRFRHWLGKPAVKTLTCCSKLGQIHAKAKDGRTLLHQAALHPRA